jgi:hypothetical protein
MTQYGSLINMLSDGGAKFDPEVGMGATSLMWSDRWPATIVQVDRFKSGLNKGEVSAIWVTGDTATRIDRNGMSDAQTYTYETNWDGVRAKYTKRKDGRFLRTGWDMDGSLRIGSREKYYDYSF